MKTISLLCSLALGSLLLSSCRSKPAPISAPIVAPAGPATAALTPAIDDSQKATAAALSRISASAGSIKAINAGQPAGPRTDGVDHEADLIANLAGVPTAEDRLAASERARIVAEGKAAEIAAAYAKESAVTDQLRAALAAKDAALDSAQARAAAEQAAQQKKFQDEIDRITREANARVEAAALKAKAEQDAKINFWLQIGSFGLGVMFCIGAVAAGQFAMAAPFIGPNIIRCLWAIGGGLIALGLLIRSVDRFIDAHPYLFYGLLIGMALALVGAAILAWSNHHHHIGDPQRATAAAG